jgi:FKBP-type peptidyl-prolyl cis-trans isomerase FkpA
MSEITRVPLQPVGKGGVAALWAGVALLLTAGIGGAVYASHDAHASKLAPEQFMAENGKRGGVTTTPSGLEYKVLKKGAGPSPTATDVALVEYRGTLTNGTDFDASKPGQPVPMPVGQVVPGFSEALMLMNKGATYRVWIPPQLGYGERQNGPIPANSVLVFDVTLRDFMTPPPGMGMPGMMPQQ